MRHAIGWMLIGAGCALFGVAIWELARKAWKNRDPNRGGVD